MMFAFNIFSAPVWSFVGLCFQKWSGVDRSNCLQTLQKGKRRTMFYSFFFPFSFSPFLRKLCCLNLYLAFIHIFVLVGRRVEGLESQRRKPMGRGRKAECGCQRTSFAFFFFFVSFFCLIRAS